MTSEDFSKITHKQSAAEYSPVASASEMEHMEATQSSTEAESEEREPSVTRSIPCSVASTGSEIREISPPLRQKRKSKEQMAREAQYWDKPDVDEIFAEYAEALVGRKKHPRDGKSMKWISDVIEKSSGIRFSVATISRQWNKYRRRMSPIIIKEEVDEWDTKLGSSDRVFPTSVCTHSCFHCTNARKSAQMSLDKAGDVNGILGSPPIGTALPPSSPFTCSTEVISSPEGTEPAIDDLCSGEIMEGFNSDSVMDFDINDIFLNITNPFDTVFDNQ
ncbi:hypothetical protein QR680_009106 [Steinernema hermaphroditum]|uniref:Uncharacterized protein n=1 Tax=Steinernema hermaphroditum TaxID=289476 RepID=A0AA39IJ19_9BILA|nr:hypothetical protein QR680_009106 [Steinernema hermaphroditum]